MYDNRLSEEDTIYPVIFYIKSDIKKIYKNMSFNEFICKSLKIFLVLISNIANIRKAPHKQRLLKSSIVFKNIKRYQDQKVLELLS